MALRRGEEREGRVLPRIMERIENDGKVRETLALRLEGERNGVRYCLVAADFLDFSPLELDI